MLIKYQKSRKLHHSESGKLHIIEDLRLFAIQILVPVLRVMRREGRAIEV